MDFNLARMVVLYVGNIDVIRTNEWKTAGLSVRCIQDSERICQADLTFLFLRSSLLDQIGVDGVRLLSCGVH